MARKMKMQGGTANAASRMTTKRSVAMIPRGKGGKRGKKMRG